MLTKRTEIACCILKIYLLQGSAQPLMFCPLVLFTETAMHACLATAEVDIFLIDVYIHFNGSKVVHYLLYYRE